MAGNHQQVRVPLFPLSRRRLLGGAALCLVLVAAGIFVLIVSRRKETAYFDAADIAPLLQDGDVLCRLGDRIWSRYFREVSPHDKRFSHLGIVRETGGTVTVINAEGLAIEGKDYVNEVTLQDFLDSATEIGVYRLRDGEGKALAEAALEFKGRPFDWDFDLESEDRLYCTELLYAVLKRVAPEVSLATVWLNPPGRAVVPPEACSQSERFTEVCYLRLIYLYIDQFSEQVNG
ncbi:hypothetical protein FACS189468_9360 [Spirochaetia bacterium]|nr:hypothetical protein FACS189468_9360 [Spirochaetia bacterium]